MDQITFLRFLRFELYRIVNRAQTLSRQGDDFV
jgi:hypothetical protein